MTFDSFRFDERLAAGIRAAGYETPTPIQTQAIPLVLSGRDVMGLAQTGTGKTAAFVLPILQRLIDSGAPRRGPLRTVVLAPTRELALQIKESFVELGNQTGIRSAAVYGGVGIYPQVKALRQATVAVGCPGRLLDLINRGEVDLRSVDTLVLDEADRMLDMGFMPDITKILAKLPAKRQNLLFSATMPPDINRLCQGILNDPATVKVSNTAPIASVSHALFPVRKHLKAGLLEEILKTTEHDCVLVFTRTKHRAKTLAQQLERKGWSATFMQGNLSQSRRQKALDGFRNGQYRIMVATDIASRGIDCTRITHVINFDVPDNAETYTHRIGRTGRADRTGKAFSLVTAEDGLLVRQVEGMMGRKMERRTLESFDYDRTSANRSPVDEREGQRGPRGGKGRPGGGYGGNGGRGGRPVGRGGPAGPARSAQGANRSVFGASSDNDDIYRDPDGGLSRRARGENPARDDGRGGNSRGPKAGKIVPKFGKSRGTGAGAGPGFGAKNRDSNGDRDGNCMEARPVGGAPKGGWREGGSGPGSRGAGSGAEGRERSARPDDSRPRGPKSGAKPFGKPFGKPGAPKRASGNRDEEKGREGNGPARRRTSRPDAR